MTSGHEDQMVVLVNRLTRSRMSLASEEVEAFLRRHKLYEMLHVPDLEEKKTRRKKAVKVAPKVARQHLKRQAGEDSVKSSPSSRLSESVPAAKRMRTDRLSSVKLETPPALAKPNPLIVLSLKEMHEITRLFTSSPPGCADWAAIAKQTCQDRLNAGEVEYAANEFLPHVHYRSSIGKVVMERAAKAPSEFQKHKQTMKRMKQGLPLLAQKYKELTGLAPPVEGEESSKKVTISNFVSQAPESLIKELRKRAEVAMDRFVKGEVPKYALRSGMPVTDPNLTATGRIRKKYETKAIRLAKQAAEHATGNLHAPLITAVPKSAAPPFFFSTAKHFEKQ